MKGRLASSSTLRYKTAEMRKYEGIQTTFMSMLVCRAKFMPREISPPRPITALSLIPLFTIFDFTEHSSSIF